MRSFFLAVFALMASAAARADVVTLDASKDATLFQSATGSTANGGGYSFYVGLTGSMSTTPVRRGLIAFDIAGAIPVGSTVTNAVLTLYMSQTTSGSKTINLFRVTTGWSEGSTVGASGQGGASQNGDVTWIHTDKPSGLWTTPGGDFSGSSSASKSVNAIGYYTWGSTAQVVADVQGWLDAPTTNHGWLLQGPESGAKSAKKFESRISSPQWVPKLQVTFSPPPPTVYCTSKTNTLGCVPAIGSIGTPDANAGSGFAITLANTLNQKAGLLFYGTNGPKSAPFQGGTMCVMSPTRRTPILSSGGNAAPPEDSSGLFSRDFNAHIATGADPTLVAGATVWSQYWSRDPADPFTTHLSDGLRFYILP